MTPINTIAELQQLEFCTDCAEPAITGDYTSLDYFYDEATADRRMHEIEAGIESLCRQHDAYLVPLDEDFNEFSTRPCHCCGSALHGERRKFRLLPLPA